MTLDEIGETYDGYTKALSAIVRQLAFVGFAVIWLFKVEDKGSVHLDYALIGPSIAFVLTLAFDLLHGISGVVVFFLLTLVREKKNQLGDVDYEGWVIAPIEFFFVLKVLTVVAGYALLLYFLFHKLI